jgi:hypothetical protein
VIEPVKFQPFIPDETPHFFRPVAENLVDA